MVFASTKNFVREDEVERCISFPGLETFPVEFISDAKQKLCSDTNAKSFVFFSSLKIDFSEFANLTKAVFSSNQ